MFSPFDLGKWFVLGFTAWIALLFEQGGSGAQFFNQLGNLPQAFTEKHGGGPSPQAILSQLSSMADNLGAQLIQATGFGLLFWAVTIGSLVFLVWLALTIVLTWLKARFEFIFLDNCVSDTALIAEPWSSFKTVGNSLFWWQICYCLCLLVLWIVLIVALVFIFLAVYTDTYLLVTAIAATAIVILPLLLLLALVDSSLRHFVVPIMYRKSLKTIPAWGVFLTLLRTNLPAFATFLLMLIVLRIAAGIAMLFIVCATCCCCCIGIVFYLPYLSAVVILPFSVFFRLYGVEFISQFEEFAGTDAAPSPLPPTDAQPEAAG